MTPVSSATYLGIEQAATPEEVTLPPILERQLTRTPVIARIDALFTKALAYFLQAVLNAAIGFQALHLTHPKHMLQGVVTTVRHVWAIHGHQPTSLPAEIRTMGMVQTTWSTIHTPHTPRPTSTASCRTKSRK